MFEGTEDFVAEKKRFDSEASCYSGFQSRFALVVERKDSADEALMAVPGF
jgi:hypothetical protein